MLALLAAPGLAAGSPPARLAGDVARAILPCWHPPAVGGEITLALSLRRDGTVIGAPRVTYVKGQGASGQGGSGRGRADDDLRASILDAVRACTPVALSRPLGAVVAGQVLRIRFVAAPGADGGRVAVIWSGT